MGGEYREVSVDNLKLGIVLFIFREVCFFSGFFWRFFHYSLSPSGEIGSVWAPLGVFGVNPFSVPLLNTAVLLRRGVTVTWAHMQLVNNERAEFSLLFTLVLGVYFTFLQLFEYKTCSFSIRDSVFGSIFFIATGFHGVHVVVGSVFLGVCVCRMFVCHFTCVSHLGFELAIWY